ncbi:transcriptional regulator [Streptomyces sp. NPDC003943]
MTAIPAPPEAPPGTAPLAAPVSPMLIRLAAERATGALLRDHGTLYLVDGRVVHAESPSAPGVDVLLTAGGRLPREGWEEAVDRAGAQGAVGRFLVDSGRLHGGELEICHLGAVFDAAFFALAPASGPTRFRYGVGHWFGAVRPVDTGAVERETRRRRDLLDSVWPYPAVDTAPVVPRPAAPGQPVGARQRALLRAADGVRTPADLARLLGRPAFHTLLDVRRLAAAGLVETPYEAPPPAPPPVPAWVGAAAATQDPDIALLRRLRDALEAAL